MSVNAVGSDPTEVAVEIKVEAEQSTMHDTRNENVNSGEPLQGKANGMSDPNFPKDAADEWPNQIHLFYFVKCRSYEDPNLKAKIDQAEKVLQKKKQEVYKIIETLRSKKSEKTHLIEQLKTLNSEKRQCNMMMDERRNEMKPLQEALGSLRGANNPVREKGMGICSSEEELNELIRSLHYRIEHESISLIEEKQLLREIKQLEGTRESVVANAAMRVKIEDSLGQRETIQEQVKLIGTDLDGARKERQAVANKIKYLEEQFLTLKDEINALEEELKIVDEKKLEMSESLEQLRAHRVAVSKPFYDNRALLNKARDLAAKKDIKALEELSNSSVSDFISHWSSSKAFRDDYEKRMLPSLDIRQLSKDGRMRNPGEKPLVLLEASTPAAEEIASKSIQKPTKEDSKPVAHEDNLQKVQKESKKKPADSETFPDLLAVEEEKFVVAESPPAVKEEIDPVKLKEQKREEEMAKQKQALERKKKLAEKAAAKAAISAQKEADKKQKEREKKLKKKHAASGLAPNQEEPTVTEEEVAEPAKPEKTKENAETPAQAAPKEQKETTTIRARNRTKERGAIPKAILKRRRSTNYWVWGASAAAAVAAVALLVLAYNYL